MFEVVPKNLKDPLQVVGVGIKSSFHALIKNTFIMMTFIMMSRRTGVVVLAFGFRHNAGGFMRILMSIIVVASLALVASGQHVRADHVESYCGTD